MATTVATHPPKDWESYRSHLLSRAFWRPLLVRVGARERIGVNDAQLARPAGTYPTFLCGSIVVKVYTHLADGQTGFEVERAVLEALADGCVPTARLLGADEVELGGSRYWYIVMSRLGGEPLSAARQLGSSERLALAGRLGEWVAALHATDLPATLRQQPGPYHDFLLARRSGLARRLADWGSLSEATHGPLAGQLSPSLAEAAPAFIDRWLLAEPPVAEVLVHGDLHHDHVLGGGSPWRAEALIDFADARVGCPLYELGPLVISVFNGDRSLLDAFLAAYGWTIADRDLFARRALATALLHDFDVFVEWRVQIADIRSLEELAIRLFGPAPTEKARGRGARAPPNQPTEDVPRRRELALPRWSSAMT